MARLEAWFDRLRASWARLRLRACDVVGPGARVIGAPHVENRGRIELGRGFVWSSVPVRSHFVVGPHGVLRIGDDVHIAHGAALSVDAEVTIGDGSVLGPFVTILDSDYHEVNHREAHGEARAIHIGRNVRLGAGVVVLRGAIISDGAVIAPNSTVSRFIPAGARASGVPARPVASPPR